MHDAPLPPAGDPPSREQVERFRSLVAQSPNLAAVVTGPEHRFLLTNAAFEGFAAGQALIGRMMVDAISGRAGQALVERLSRVWTNGETEVERDVAVGLRAQGGVRAERRLDFVLQPIRGPQGELIAIFVEGADVTERFADAAEALGADEERLHASERLWRGLFDELGDGFMIVEIVRDTDGTARTWRFVEFNAAFERITGLSAEAALGRNVEDAIPGVEREWQEIHIRVAESGDPETLRMPVAAMGHVYDVRASRIGPDRVGVLFREVSAEERGKERRAALLELNDRLAGEDDPSRLPDIASEILGTTLGVQLVGYGEVDPKAETITVERDWSTGDARTLAGTLSFRDFGSYIDDLKRGETVVVSDARTDPRTSAFASALEERSARAFVNMPVFERGRFLALQYVSTRSARTWSEGDLDFIHETASRTRTAVARRAAEAETVTLNDSLERQVAERTRDLQQSEARASTFFNFSDDYLFLIRVSADGRTCFEDINPACERVMGLVRAEVVGEPVETVLPANSAEDIAHYARRCLESRAPQTYLAVREYQAQQNSIIEGRVAFVDRSAAGGLVLFSGRDVTEQRRTEEALRQAQKMEAVGQLTGGLAHDFNNLLTGIMGNLELLQSRVARGRLDDLDRFINAAQGAGRRAASLTQRLLAFSRRQTLDPRPTDVNRLLAGLEDLLRRTVGATAEIEIVQAAGLWTVDIDAAQLENAILNLCLNGRDAMPGGGKLTVETANKWIDDRAGRERDLSPGQYISVCVTDTGTGMPPEVVARAFEPFYTTKPLGQGTGLGLSMIYGFARQSGGQVRIYSEPGEGTTVCVYLPRHHGEAEAAGDVDAGMSQQGATGQTVLIVDDEATIRHLVDEVLDELGYTVIGAADGAAGLKVLQSGARIELLITDVGLPNGMNGRQVADAARALRPGLKVLFITGFAENAAIGNGHLEPGMELLTKPFTLEALARKVADMLA